MTGRNSAFPPEIFSEIINAIATRTPGVPLTRGQMTTLKTCVLVCRLFQMLSEPHIFRYLSFNLRGFVGSQMRLNRLVDLLESRPVMLKYVRDIDLDFKRCEQPFESGKPINDFRRTDAIIQSLPNVESINFHYTRSDSEAHYSQPQTLGLGDAIGSLFHSIIEVHASRGTLRSLTAKKMGDIPFPLIATRTMLSTLSLDRCNLPSLGQPMPTVKSLTLRKMDLPVSALSYFPNLEDLHILRLDIERCIDFTRFPAPSFKLKTLALEHCSEYGGAVSIDDSISAFWTYFQGHAERHGTRPFEHLQTLGLTSDGDPKFSKTASIVKDVPNVQNLLLVFPSLGSLSLRDLIYHLRKGSNPPGSLLYFSIFDIHIPDLAVLSQTALMQHIMTYQPSCSFGGDIFEYEAFKSLDGVEMPQRLNFAALEYWGKGVAVLSEVYPEFAESGAVELYLTGLPPLKATTKLEDMTEQDVEDMACKKGKVLGMQFGGFTDNRSIRPLKLVFISDD